MIERDTSRFSENIGGRSLLGGGGYAGGRPERQSGGTGGREGTGRVLAGDDRLDDSVEGLSNVARSDCSVQIKASGKLVPATSEKMR